MRRLFLTGAALAAVLLATPARAQVSLGARTGYGFGLGNVGGALGMDDWVRGQLPVQVDALWRVNARLALGVYFSHGFGRLAGDVRDACDLPGADCSAWVRRLGVQGSWAFAPRRRVVPWMGAGIGYEWSRVEETRAAGTTDTTFKGWEYLSLQGGADFAVASRLLVGPFVLLSISQYGEAELSGSFGAGGGPVQDKKLHEWLTVGLRGRFDL